MSVLRSNRLGSAAEPRGGPDQRAGAVVGDAMVRRPVVHPPSTTVAQARTALSDPHRHLLLVVWGDLLLGTLERDDLGENGRDGESALTMARLAGRTVAAHESLTVVHAAMVVSGRRRRAVVDPDGALLGLLCLKASGAGFCSDEGIAARHASAS